MPEGYNYGLYGHDFAYTNFSAYSLYVFILVLPLVISTFFVIYSKKHALYFGQILITCLRCPGVLFSPSSYKRKYALGTRLTCCIIVNGMVSFKILKSFIQFIALLT